MIAAFWRQYLASSAKAAAEFEPRVLRLLPLLLLARVDGKSPAEYLDSTRQEFIRRFVTEELRHGGLELAPFMQSWLGQSRSVAPIIVSK
jgi:hypothetical protein